MSERLSFATATGLPLLFLAFHFATGLVALAAGFVAITVRKGGTWHRRGGIVFVYAMIATGITAAGIAVYDGSPNATGGALTAYLVFTAYTAVKPLAGAGPRVQIALMVVPSTVAAALYVSAFTALGRPGNQIGGAPAGMLFFLATIALLAALGDFRMIRAGGIQGTRRLARHLWRMSFGLFIASGSFFFGQMKFIPKPIRIVPVIAVLGVSPLVILVYWMWRIRLRRNVRGIIELAGRPIDLPANT